MIHLKEFNMYGIRQICGYNKDYTVRYELNCIEPIKNYCKGIHLTKKTCITIVRNEPKFSTSHI